MYIDGIIHKNEWYLPSRGEMLRRAYYPIRLETKKHSKVWGRIFKFLGRFSLALLLMFSLIYAVINAPVIYNKIRYSLNHKDQKPNKSVEAAVISLPKVTATSTPTPSPDQTIVQDGYLLIPKLEVNAPIVYMQSMDENAVLADLKSGVGHYPGTANPGQIGNVVITGHSSFYWWDDGQYNQVFALLENLAVGDKIYIGYGGKRYIYQVSESKVINPEDVQVLAQTNDSRLSLITCVPVGTNLQRLVVTAMQIEPDPASNGQSSVPLLPSVDKLPGLDKN